MHFDPQHLLARPVPAAYLPLIERMEFYIGPEISCSRFFGAACFTEKSIQEYRQSNEIKDLELTELGNFIANHVRNGLFIDIPCGLHSMRGQDVDFEVPKLVEALAIAEMWEIDSTAGVIQDRVPQTINILKNGYAFASRIGEIGMRRENSIQVCTMQDDILGFFAKLNTEKINKPKAIYISAIQPNEDFCTDREIQKNIAVPYLQSLYDELSRITKSGDLVILNSSAMLCAGINESIFPNIHPALALPPKGFSLMRRCALNKVQVFLKE